MNAEMQNRPCAKIAAAQALNENSVYQLLEIISRLDSSQYLTRDPQRTRREDGSIVLSLREDGVQTVSLRLNAFSSGMRAVTVFSLVQGSPGVESLMIRGSAMDADDRSRFAIPQPVTLQQMPIVENMLFAAAVCIGRGQVSTNHDENSTERKKFGLFLPSRPQLVILDSQFSPIGLESQY